MTARQVFVTLDLDASGFLAALERVSKVLDRLHLRPDGSLRKVDVHHPRPLSIDGAAYARRRRARSRRNR